MSLKVNIKQKNCDIYIVAPCGDIDTESYNELDKAIQPVVSGASNAIMIDMQGVNYISSMGLSVIFEAKKAMEAKKGFFLIINPQPQIKKVFEVIEAAPTLDIFPSIKKAEEYLVKAQIGKTRSDKK